MAVKDSASTNASSSAPEAQVVPRLKTRYEDEIVPELTRRFAYQNPMQVPRLVKVSLNMGVGEAKQDSKMLEAAQEQLATIAGQKPNVRRATSPRGRRAFPRAA